MKRTLVLNIVGLSKNLLGDNTPFINSLIEKGSLCTISHLDPAVTCSVQSTYLTGLKPSDHGIVGNGWYNREMSEVMFWKQSNHLVKGEMLWDIAKKRNDDFSCAQLFWWYNMYNSADWSVTPRPLYPADGRKVPDIYASSDELRFELTEKLGQFPLFNFWGPTANMVSSKWIAQSAIHIDITRRPTLNLVYIPHLDYCLQKFGPNSSEVKEELREIDELIKYIYQNIQVDEYVILSEYSISEVDEVIYPNRELRKLGLIGIKKEFDYEMLDPGKSDCFAVCDHQIAHLYCNESVKEKVIEHFSSHPAVTKVLFDDSKREHGLDHERAGDIILISKNNAWFSYYFWDDDSKAPDYARTVDIHRKPGYDPVELFIDPKLKWAKLRIIFKVLKKKLGFRQLMDVIPMDATLVKGSHGAKPQAGHEPVFISSLKEKKEINATEIKDRILELIFN